MNNSLRRASTRQKSHIFQPLSMFSAPARSCFFAGLVIAFLVAAAAGYAQTTTGSIFGTVTDPSGAVIPGVTVTATNVQNGLAQTATSNATGNYIFPVVDPGVYTVRAVMSGFQQVSQSDVRVSATQNVHVNFSLQTGSSSQTVHVTAATTLVDTRESQIGTTVDQRRITELPLNGRDAYTLVQLAPGVTSYTSNTNIGNPNGVTFSVNGIRAFENSFYLDGGFNTAVYRVGGNLIPNPDALQEFRILTANYDAEYGRSPGGVVNVITRSGSNQFHGLVYDYLRNDVFNAKSYFNPVVTPLKQNQFGATLGGPIHKDKAFFFLSYQGLRVHTPVIISAGIVTPTPAEAGGNFSAYLPTSSGPITACNQALSPADKAAKRFIVCNPATNKPFPGNILTTPLDPVAQNLLKTVPLADPNTGVTPAQTASANQSANQGLARVDYQLTDTHRLEGMFFTSRGTQTLPNLGGNQILDYSGASDYANQTNAILADTWVASPSAVNSLRLFYTLNHFIAAPLFANNTLADLGSNAGQGTLPATQPRIIVTGYWTMGVGGAGNNNQYDQSYGGIDTFYWTHGNHTAKFGGSFLWSNWQENGLFLGSGQATFSGSSTGNALADFLLGRANTFEQNSGAIHRLHAPDPALFAQDDWKVNRNLTLDLGLRWEVYPPYTGENNNGTFVPNVQSTRFPTAPLGLLSSGDPGVPDGIRHTSYTKFAPRVGFAYDVFGNGKTSIRGAFGIFYSANHESLWENLEQQPFTLDVVANKTPNLVNPYSPSPDPFPYVIDPQNPRFTSGATIYGIPQGKNSVPYFEEYNLAVQQQLGTNWSTQIAYVGNVGRQLYMIRDDNSPVYVPGGSTTTAGLNARRPYQPTPATYTFGAINLTDPVANSSYNSLQVTVTRRFAHDFSVDGSFVWSRAIDIYSPLEGLNPALVNENDPAMNRGLSDLAVPKSFFVSYLWALPSVQRWGTFSKLVLNGWQVNGITTIQSGSPFNLLSGVDSNLDGISTDRPDQIADPFLSTHRGRTAKIAQYFNTAAFAQVPAGTPYGNVGRNSMLGPGLVNTDLSAFKTFALWKTNQLQFRGEIYNLFNNVNLSNPNSNLKSPQFGKITGSAAGRIVQLALRYSF